MIGRWILATLLMCCVSSALAQEPSCTFFKVNTSLLNVSDKAGSNVFIDVLEDGQIVCVSSQVQSKGIDWAYISYRLADSTKRTPVNGWAGLRDMTQLSPNEVVAMGSDKAVVAQKAEGAPVMSAAPPATPSQDAGKATAGSTAAASANTPSAMRAEDILRFDQKISFGAFPVNGRSIQEIIASSKPLFSPIEGLDRPIWEKNCGECHKWDQARMCEQGKTYAKAPRNVLRVKHPFGGTFKIALMRWAKSGCE